MDEGAARLVIDVDRAREDGAADVGEGPGDGQGRTAQLDIAAEVVVVGDRRGQRLALEPGRSVPAEDRGRALVEP